MGRRFRDFDAQFAEMRHETITIKVYGKEYEFPAVIPAYVPLEMAKYEGGQGAPNRVMLNAARVMFGDEALSEWSSHRDFDMQKLGLIIKQAFEMINGEDEYDNEPTSEDDATDGRTERKK